MRIDTNKKKNIRKRQRSFKERVQQSNKYRKGINQEKKVGYRDSKWEMTGVQSEGIIVRATKGRTDRGEPNPVLFVSQNGL